MPLRSKNFKRRLHREWLSVELRKFTGYLVSAIEHSEFVVVKFREIREHMEVKNTSVPFVP
jgi:hypothetical protein